MAEVKSQGTEVFFVSADSPQTLNKLAKVSTFDGLGGSASEIDITNFDSTRKEFLRGIRDGGTVNLSLNLSPGDSTQTKFFALEADGDSVYWCIALSDGTPDPTLSGNAITAPASRSSFIFQGFVQQATITGQQDDAIRCQVQIRVTGDITYTPKT
jgi:Phage tail tube, TTP, lambda-like